MAVIFRLASENLEEPKAARLPSLTQKVEGRENVCMAQSLSSLSKDYELTVVSAETLIKIAHIHILLNRL